MKNIRQTLYGLLVAVALASPSCGHKAAATAGGSGDGGGDSGAGGGALIVDTGFSVSSIVPADAAEDVAVSDNIVVTFNEPVDDSTLEGNFVVSSSGTAVGGTFSTNEDKTVVTFDPTSNLAMATTYDVTLSNSIKNSSGISLTEFSSIFETAVAPTVVVKNAAGTALASSGDAVAPTDDLKLFFSEPMSADTVSTSSVIMICNGVAVVPAISEVDHDSDSIEHNEWTLFFGLLPQNDCVLSFGDSITDANGVAMAATDFSFDSTCGPNDEFSDATTLQNCWTENDSDNLVTLDINTTASGKLFFAHESTDYTNGDEYPVLWKRVTGDFAATVSFNSTDSGASQEQLLLSAVEAQTPVTNALDLWFGRNSNYHPTSRVVYFDKTISDVDTTAESAALTTVASKIYFCIVRSGDVVTGYYAANAGDSFVAISGASMTLSTTDETDIQIGGISTGNGFTFQADYIRFNAGSTTCPAAE